MAALVQALQISQQRETRRRCRKQYSFEALDRELKHCIAAVSISAQSAAWRMHE